MCNAKLLEIPHKWLHFVPHGSWLVVEHIFRKTWTANHGSGNLPAAIRQATRALIMETSLDHETPSDYETKEENCVRILCNAAARKMATRSILYYLDSETEQGERYEGPNCTTNHLVSAAACLGDLKFFIRLSSEGTIDSSENIYFGNPLRCAVDHGNYELTRFLLNNGVDVNMTSGYRRTVLELAAFAGQKDFTHLILNPKYNCDTSGEDYEYAILRASAGGHLEIVQLLIEHVNKELTQLFRNRLLFEAAKHGQDEVVVWALQIGADPNNCERCNGWSVPITAAAARGYYKVIQILLENGAIPKPNGGRMRTLFPSLRRSRTLDGPQARRQGYKRAVQLLLDNGMKIDPQDL